MLFSLQIDTGIRYYQIVDACEPQTQEAKFIALILSICTQVRSIKYHTTNQLVNYRTDDIGNFVFNN